MATISVTVNDAKLTAANWAAFLEMNPLPDEGPPDEGPPDVSTKAKKRDYIESKMAAWLNFQVKRGRQRLDSRAASAAVGDVEMDRA